MCLCSVILPLERAGYWLYGSNLDEGEILLYHISAMVKLALMLLRFYKLAISPYLPVSCRFLPTCSEYACQALVRYGFWRGSWLTARRLLRCHPFAMGGFDPVP